MQLIHEFDATKRPNCLVHRWLKDGEVSAIDEHDFRFDETLVTDVPVRALAPLEKDLRDVAILIHLADRLALRHPHGARDLDGVFWSRHMRMRIGVRDIERWEQEAVKAPLRQFLEASTGDYWELEFVEYPQWQQRSEQLVLDFSTDKRRNLHSRFPHWDVALCSEGLDSWAGVADQLQRDNNKRLLLVTFSANPRVKQHQRRLLELLRFHCPQFHARIKSASFSLNLCQSERASLDGHEKSLRTRSLLFLTAGALAAQVMGRDKFFVFENGIGALNPTFDEAQLPGQANRAVHPLILGLFGQFVSALWRTRLRVENPYLFSTKAQLVRSLDLPGWRELIPYTFTCGHEHRKPGRWHCGACDSCLMRRWSLRAANLWREDTSCYVHDLNDPTAVPERHQEEWRKCHRQMRRIETALGAGSDSNIWHSLQTNWPELSQTQDIFCSQSGLSPAEFPRRLISLFRQHSAEGLALGATPLQELSTSPAIRSSLQIPGLELKSVARAA